MIGTADFSGAFHQELAERFPPKFRAKEDGDLLSHTKMQFFHRLDYPCPTHHFTLLWDKNTFWRTKDERRCTHLHLRSYRKSFDRRCQQIVWNALLIGEMQSRATHFLWGSVLSLLTQQCTPCLVTPEGFSYSPTFTNYKQSKNQLVLLTLQDW